MFPAIDKALSLGTIEAYKANKSRARDNTVGKRGSFNFYHASGSTDLSLLEVAGRNCVKSSSHFVCRMCSSSSSSSILFEDYGKTGSEVECSGRVIYLRIKSPPLSKSLERRWSRTFADFANGEPVIVLY